MKRQTMIAALALLVSPLGSMSGPSRVSAEEQQDVELYSVSGNEQEKVQLDAPTNLRWGGDQQNPNNKYGMQWSGVNPSTSTGFWG